MSRASLPLSISFQPPVCLIPSGYSPAVCSLVFSVRKCHWLACVYLSETVLVFRFNITKKSVSSWWLLKLKTSLTVIQDVAHGCGWQNLATKQAGTWLFLQRIVMETAFPLSNLHGIRIQKSTSKVYVENLDMNCAILKPKLFVKKKTIFAAGYIY